MDYPVNWGLNKIIRDLIQNFYDASGPERFAGEFSVNVSNRDRTGYKVVMESTGHPFSYEWLLYIGASTKTESEEQYIGKYGEGFKICVLCLLNRFHAKVSMESQNWTASPMKYRVEIDGKDTEMLGMRVRERKDDHKTRLVIRELKLPYKDFISDCILEFFYEGNPLIGEAVISTEQVSIFRRSAMPIPCRQKIKGFKGILYSNRLARGRLPFELVILLHGKLKDNSKRNRETYSDRDVRLVLYRAAEEIFDAEVSYALLKEMESYWNDMPERIVDRLTWYYLICQLVRNVSRDEKTAERFRKEYTNLVCFERKGSDRIRNEWIREAMRYYDAEKIRQAGYRVVNPIFRKLGAFQLVEEYYSISQKRFIVPNDQISEACDKLFDLISEILPVHLYCEKPAVLLSDERIDPLTFSRREYSRSFKYKRYELEKLVMSPKDFQKGRFERTFLKFADQMLHAYGTSHSAMHNVYLTELSAACINHSGSISECRRWWEDHWAEKEMEV